MKKKTIITAIAAAVVLVIGTTGCGGSASSGGRDSKQEGNSGSGNQYEEPAGGEDNKKEDGDKAEKSGQEEQEKRKPVRSEGQEIVKITSEAEEGYSSELERLFAEGIGDLLCREELTWFGDHISTLDYEAAMTSLEKNGFHIEEDVYNAEGDYFSGEAYYKGDGTFADVFQQGEEGGVEYIDLMASDSGTGPVYTTEIRDIAVGDSMETVLDKLGFTNVDEIMAYITEKQKLHYASNEECYETAHTYLTLERADGSQTIISVSIYLTVEMDGSLYRIGREGENGAIYIGHYLESGEDCAVTMVFDTDYSLMVFRLS